MRKFGFVLLFMTLTIWGAVAMAQDMPATPTNREAVILTATAFAEQPAATPVPPSASRSNPGRTIVLDQETTDELTGERTAVRFTLNATENVAYRIEVASDMDTYLLVEDLDGNIVAQDDDSGDNRNALITQFVPMQSGTYEIVVTTFDAYNQIMPVPTGAFTLMVTEGKLNILAYGQSVTDSVLPEGNTYTFIGAEGDVVLVSMESATLDSYLTLDDPFGNEVGYDDDSGDNRNALLGPVVLAEDGNYTIQASVYSFDETGEFTLTLTKADPIAATLGEPLTVPASDVPTVVTITFDEPTFVEITTDGEGGDYHINDGFGYRVTNGTLGTPLDFYVEYEDTYTVYLPPNDAALTLTIAESSIPTLDDGDVELLFNGDRTEALVAFTVEADETVQITITPAEDYDYWDVSADFVIDDIYDGYFSGNSGDALSFTKTFDRSGEVRMTVYSYSSSDTTLIVSLSRP
jgi:hypothetical protein